MCASSTRSWTASSRRPWRRWPCRTTRRRRRSASASQGEGKREVRVGYVIENPIWKTSYRLVLDKKEQAVPARLGHGREPHRRGLEGRAHGPGLAAGPSPSRWTSISRCTSRGRSSSRNCFASLRPPTYRRRSGERRPMAGWLAKMRMPAVSLPERLRAPPGAVAGEC